MFSFVLEIVAEAEKKAAGGATLTHVLPPLRKLGLDDFGLLFLSMPNSLWPNLSRILPRMADKNVQERFTGSSGIELFRQTAIFVRQLENNFVRESRTSLRDKQILDFGCGYGRLIRMMYYFSSPSQLIAVDAEETPLRICKDDGVEAHFVNTKHIPTSIPIRDGSVDLAYAYSVFTHLPKYAAEACLNAVKAALKPGGLFVVTVCPVELWTQGGIAERGEAQALIRQHNVEGFAHRPHEIHKHYGWSTVKFDFFHQCGWSVVGYDTSLTAPLQVILTLRRT
ncbi:class I SAM-dependent methyltransferase [Methylocystis rosea]|uniref:Class I SAM-dependent methyltransferase n=1 Tax=Methylocystis rosea TaxID=173366 RepID=A0A3G8M7Y4_9HYPH|nr:class I SAM-dependent methyltransferase [Methylocystis rosea]AZG78083.1 class I SAM-dependent methyltransferase [Methylocystis rosea]